MGAMHIDAFWRRDACPFVLHATVRRERQAAAEDRLRLAELPGRKSVLITADGVQHVLIREQYRAVQLICDGDNVLDANAVLTFHTHGFHFGDRPALTYRRLRSLRRRLRFAPSLFKSAPRARHLRNALIALDGDLAGLSQRQIGIRLYGDALVSEQWIDADARLRLRVKNAIKRGRALMAGDYRKLLSGQ